jgi:hypothetical protein
MTDILAGFFPARGLAFIRHIQTAETYAGSPIVIPEQARDRVAKQQFVVTSVGDYERCDDPDECNRPHHRGLFHKHRLMVGDWVLARNRSWMLTPDPDVYVIRQADILGTFQEKT